MTLAEMKRTIRVGTLLKLTRHEWLETHVVGSLSTKVLKSGTLYIGLVRPVVLVQSNQIALRTEGSATGMSYLTWPKAHSIRFVPNGFEIDLNQDGTFREIMAYEIVQP